MAMFITTTSSASAMEVSMEDSNAYIDNKMISEYSEYDIDIQDIDINSSLSNAEVLSEVLDSGEIIKEQNLAGTNVISYNTELVSDFLPESSNVIAVEKVGGKIYLQYKTDKNETVILCYSEKGLVNKGIYNPTNDETIIIDYQKGQSVRYENFIKNSCLEITPEQDAAIDLALSNEDYDALNQIDNISLQRSEDSVIINLEPEELKVKGVKSVKANFVSPKSQFVPYTKKAVSSQNKYCTYLGENVTISVKESMDTYKQTKADYKSFVAGTAITAVGLYLGGISVSVAVLAGLGVLNSAKDTITQAVKLYKSATYDYSGAKEGYAYDTTAHYNDVKVYYNRSKGVLAGGNNSKGKFTWIDYQPSKALSKATSYIIDKTIYNYNADLTVHGYCESYWPD